MHIHLVWLFNISIQVLCKPKILALKSVTLEKLEIMQKQVNVHLPDGVDGWRVTGGFVIWAVSVLHAVREYGAMVPSTFLANFGSIDCDEMGGIG